MNNKATFLTRQVQASSLLEVVISLVVIMVVFGIAMATYINVSRSSNSMKQLDAAFALHEAYLNTKLRKAYFDEDINYKEYKIYKKVTNYKQMNALYCIELRMMDRDETLLSQRKDLVIVDNEE